ncbi:hypothetical protein ABT160_31185 [Streptomyces sp. NPDC001941]|uniref:hypothetical protein n=1 Tax=Streptomyces sp. NPDC001941 TaxID=3154659 RepID=UPI00331A1DA1
MERSWRLMHGDTLVGELRLDGVDQPWFLCHFTAGPGWEEVRALFEGWDSLSGPDPDGQRNSAYIKPLMALGMTLVDEIDGRTLPLFHQCIVRIGGQRARVRC